MLDPIIKDLREKMDKTLDVMAKDFSNVRTGRANPGILDSLRVEYYGAQVPLQQVANVAVVEGRTLEIKPFDKGALAEIEKAVFQANLGLTPQNDGKVVRISFPQPTAEGRKELAKTVKKLAEDARVALRNIRRDANDKIKGLGKSKELSEDQVKDGEGQVQKLTDAQIKRVDELAAKKEQEVLTL
jgi:ribosome recycling factor